LILLSPPLRTTNDSDLLYWNNDSRPITALVPEFDDYLKPEQARKRFSIVPSIKVIATDGAKHLWLGEPFVHKVLSQINSIVTSDTEDLPLEF
jgi:hypothetical protein